MARPATGSVLERRAISGDVTYALRFRALGERQYVTLGKRSEGWTKAKAETELSNVLADVRRGLWQPPAPESVEAPEADPSFHDFAEDWFAARETGWRKNTRLDYRWALEYHLLGFFGDYRLSEIDAELIDRYATEKQREGKLSNNSINKTLKRLSQVLETAVDYEKITRNPAQGRKRRLPASQPSRPVVEPEQLIALLDGCSRALRPLVGSLAGAGLRIDEAIRLTWADLNLASGTMKVRDAKTEAGVRSIDLPIGLAEELRALKSRRPRARPTLRVFLNRDGKPQTARNAQARLKTAIRAANKKLEVRGIDPIPENATPHSLRRCFASMRFAAGDDPVYVSSQLGHTDPTFSMRVYAQAVKRRNRLSGAHLDGFDAALDWAQTGTNGDSVPGPEENDPRREVPQTALESQKR